METQEQWKPVKGFPNYYVSNLGRVRSVLGKGRILKATDDHNKGYDYVGLYPYRCGPQKKIKVHRLVAEAFLPNPSGFETVDHINGDKKDNRACNLRWMTAGDNIEAYMNRAAHRHKKTFQGWGAGPGGR